MSLLSWVCQHHTGLGQRLFSDSIPWICCSLKAQGLVGLRDLWTITNLYSCVTCCQTQRGAVMSRGYLVVGGDIGGTNSRLKLYEVKEKDIGLTEGLR